MEDRLTFPKACMDEIFAIERMTLWLIIPAFLFYLFTGYSATRWRIIPARYAIYMHIIACGLFTSLILIHVLGRARCALARHKIAGSKTDTALLIAGLLVLAFLSIMEFI